MFSEAKEWRELTRGRVLELAGGTVGMAAFERVFPGRRFTAMRHTWLLQRIKAAMDTVFATAHDQRDVTLGKVAALAGCSSVAVAEIAGSEFRARRAALPDSLADSRERVLASPPTAGVTRVNSDEVVELFDGGWLPLEEGLPQTRVVAARHRAPGSGKPMTVGKRVGEWVYELFITTLPIDGFLVKDVLDLYHGRGAEDRRAR